MTIRKGGILVLLLIIIGACGDKTKETEKVPVKTISKKRSKPNILLLLADDMGYGELGTYGQETIKTPFLDEFASRGMRFTDFYAGTSVCSPSRAVLMTGLHTGHLSIRGNKGLINGKWDRVPLKKSEITIAEVLRKAGYQTAMIGKWHLGVPEDYSTWAKGRGFDYAVQEQWGEDAKGNEIDERIHWVNNTEDSIFYNYNDYKCLDEFRTNFALEYLDKKDDDKPFFLYMSYRIPHAHEYFLSKTDLYSDKIEEWPEIERRHAARVTMLDAQIRRLIDSLEERGELENTLVIYTSDNGPTNENHHNYKFFNSSGGLKGHKRDVYEGGVRVPMLAYWEGKIKPGTVSGHQSTFYDIMPTLAQVAGTQTPKNIDGISLLPEFLGKPQKKHDFLYWEIQEGKSVKGFRQATRIGNWKAVRYGNNYHTELYDLGKDKHEKFDVSNLHPKIVKKANEILKRESNKSENYPFSGGVFKN
ncbi:sulfatase-like hydrolase/transferase [Flavivirga abyssicola]|uniref:sulfatase-like hydrolase/transferase n=1 Tax=Flavivirga abyssicola TaxID=3063533 RepID=UPI0026DEF431|nr:sulfatase-like hydrolase/transferase [Flavivirga sp. MEBiC07777]WVK13754.1 sulfatase-like hydrolase/transferase [Flavivirga sp. MEBiC07777]